MTYIKELAALTAAEMDNIYLRNVPTIVLEQYATRLIATLEQQVLNATAREAKLRDAAKAVLEVGMGSDFEALNAAFALTTDDSALMERLKQERLEGYNEGYADAERSMT